MSSDECKSVYFKEYVHDIFLLFQSACHIKKINELLDTKHGNINFTNKKEINGSLSFLYVLISRNKKGFTAKVYHKPKFSEVYFNYNSFTVDECKHGLIFTLHFRIFPVILDFFKLHEEVKKLH